VEATRALASACAQRSVFLIYISTDYVFPGKPGDAPYEADAEPAPTNLYGLTKLDGEKAVLAEYEAAGKVGSAVVLRVPVLYGQVSKDGGNAESAVNTLMDVVVNSAKEGAKKVKMDHWAVRYPTNTEDVARVCYGEFLLLIRLLAETTTNVLQTWQSGISSRETSSHSPGSCSFRARTSTPSMRCASCSLRLWGFRSIILKPIRRGTILMPPCNDHTTAT